MGRPIFAWIVRLLVTVGTVEAVAMVRRQEPPTTLPENWSYKGCYMDSVAARTLRSSATGSADMSAEKCIAYCSVRGYSLAGTEYGQASRGAVLAIPGPVH